MGGGRGGTMGKRIAEFGGIIAVVALVVGVVTPAVGSSSRHRTFSVTAVFTEFDPNIDVGAPGFSLGDEVVFSGDLYRQDEKVGRVGLVCTFVSTQNPNRVEAQCPGTAILPEGQIAVSGVIVNESLDFTLPITGGSGQFDDADGQMVSHDVSTPTQPKVELTFELG
jgi:hypothetical protein